MKTNSNYSVGSLSNLFANNILIKGGFVAEDHTLFVLGILKWVYGSFCLNQFLIFLFYLFCILLRMAWILVLILCDELMIWLHSLLHFLLLWTRFTLFCFDFLRYLLDGLCCDKLWLSETAMVCESRSNMIINECPILRLFDWLGPFLSLNSRWRFLLCGFYG